VAVAVTFTLFHCSSLGGDASAKALIAPCASYRPSGITSGVVTWNPSGSPSISTRIGPLKLSMRSAFTVNALPLPALTLGSLPLTVTEKSGTGRRTISS
jgi:hypothetical protein